MSPSQFFPKVNLIAPGVKEILARVAVSILTTFLERAFSLDFRPLS